MKQNDTESFQTDSTNRLFVPFLAEVRVGQEDSDPTPSPAPVQPSPSSSSNYSPRVTVDPANPIVYTPEGGGQGDSPPNSPHTKSEFSIQSEIRADHFRVVETRLGQLDFKTGSQYPVSINGSVKKR